MEKDRIIEDKDVAIEELLREMEKLKNMNELLESNLQKKSQPTNARRASDERNRKSDASNNAVLNVTSSSATSSANSCSVTITHTLGHFWT